MTYFDLNKDVVSSLKPYLPTFNIIWHSHFQKNSGELSVIAGSLEFIQDKTNIEKRVNFDDTFASLKRSLNEYVEQEDEENDMQERIFGFSVWLFPDRKRLLEFHEVTGLTLTDFLYNEELTTLDPRFMSKAIACVLDIFAERIRRLNLNAEQQKELEIELAKLKTYLTKTFQ